jgi:hypothetical protein
LGLTYLARPDSLLLIFLAVAAGCALIVTGRFDVRAGWFAVGLAVTLPGFTYLMPFWGETDQTRPSSAQDVPVRSSIWQVEGT